MPRGVRVQAAPLHCTVSENVIKEGIVQVSLGSRSSRTVPVQNPLGCYVLSLGR